MADMRNVVAAIWVAQDGDEMTLTIDDVQDVIPYDRPTLASVLRKLADRVDEASTATDVPR